MTASIETVQNVADHLYAAFQSAFTGERFASILWRVQTRGYRTREERIVWKEIAQLILRDIDSREFEQLVQ